jgi:hypothetical protein
MNNQFALEEYQGPWLEKDSESSDKPLLPILFAEIELPPRWDGRGVGACKIKKKA